MSASLKRMAIIPPSLGDEYHHPCGTDSTNVAGSDSPGCHHAMPSNRSCCTRRAPSRRARAARRPVASTIEFAESCSPLSSQRRQPRSVRSTCRALAVTSCAPASTAASRSMTSSRCRRTCHPWPRGLLSWSHVCSRSLPQAARFDQHESFPKAVNESHTPRSSKACFASGSSVSPCSGRPPALVSTSATTHSSRAAASAAVEPATPAPITAISTTAPSHPPHPDHSPTNGRCLIAALSMG
jgi:hypothetical protein